MELPASLAHLPEGIELVPGDVSAGDWVAERLLPFRGSEGGVRVGALIPTGFEAYARVFHPAGRAVGGRREPVRWSEIATERGTVVHPEMQFEGLIGSLDLADFGEPPSAGCLREPEVPGAWEDAEAVHIHAGPMLVLRVGGLRASEWRRGLPLDRPGGVPKDGPPARTGQAARARSHPEGADPPVAGGAGRPPLVPPVPRAGRRRLALHLRRWNQSPNLWWPDDRAWCVATEIYGYSTYMGGSRPCIDAVLASPDLEALPSAATHRFVG